MGERNHAQYCCLLLLLIAGIIAVLDGWQDRNRAILRVANAEFQKLGPEEKKVMVMAIKDDDRRMREQRR